MNLTTRLERPADYCIVKELTREAFWENTECGVTVDEHLLVHKLRKLHIFVPDLDYVAEIDGRIVGSVMYSKPKIVAGGSQEYEVLTFGPLSILPEYQNQGVGKEIDTICTVMQEHSRIWGERGRQVMKKAAYRRAHAEISGVSPGWW